MTVVDSQSSFMFVAFMAARCRLCSLADGATTILGFKHYIPITWRYPKETGHATTSVAFLNCGIVFVADRILRTFFRVNAICVSGPPDLHVIRSATFAVSVAFPVIGEWLGFTAFTACEHR
jgi:hypothetical protein